MSPCLGRLSFRQSAAEILKRMVFSPPPPPPRFRLFLQVLVFCAVLGTIGRFLVYFPRRRLIRNVAAPASLCRRSTGDRWLSCHGPYQNPPPRPPPPRNVSLFDFPSPQGYPGPRPPQQDRPVRGDDPGGAALRMLPGVLGTSRRNPPGHIVRPRCVMCGEIKQNQPEAGLASPAFCSLLRCRCCCC